MAVVTIGTGAGTTGEAANMTMHHDGTDGTRVMSVVVVETETGKEIEAVIGRVECRGLRDAGEDLLFY